MDLTNRAIRLAEDSATAVEALRAKLPLRKLYAGDTSLNDTSFGHMRLTVPAAVVAVFTGGTCSLEFGDAVIATGVSPLIGIIPAGSAELKLSAARDGATALII